MKTITILLLAFVCLPATFATEGSFSVENEFLSVDLSQFTQTVEEEDGLDLVYLPAGNFERLAEYTRLMIDQPEIWLDPDSDYRGVKPDNQKAIADLIRERLIERVISRGYDVVDEPGPDVLYIRVALTDLYLKKEKRGILGYTPIGAVVKLSADMVRDMMSKVDIIEMALQIEMLDSQSQEVLAAIVVKRGAREDKDKGQELQRMNFDEFRSVVQEYGARLACRLDNARQPKPQQINCVDDDALEAAGYLIPSE